jgi:hypothetical protein
LSTPSPKLDDGRPNTFQGWQRGACITAVIVLALFTLCLLVVTALGVLDIH